VKKDIKVIDLFAGLGGLRLGFETSAKSLGFTSHTVFSSEIKPHAIKAYEANFPGETVTGDITLVDETTIPDFDVLLAGFPCQPFSSAGKGLGFVDTRGTLFFDIERILAHKRPSAFVLENVEGLVTHDREFRGDKVGLTLRTIVSRLTDLGYKVSWNVFDASAFGLAQRRKRIYITGTRAKEVNLSGFTPSRATLSSVLDRKCDKSLHVDEAFTDLVLRHFPAKVLPGKQIKDKRGGSNNIHSWDIELKGAVSPSQRDILEKLLRQRRRKDWAVLKGIPWADGMPLTLEEILTFVAAPGNVSKAQHRKNVFGDLEDLVDKGYLTFEHPKRSPESPKGYNISTGKLSFPVSNILDPNDVTPTLVATDVTRLAVVCSHGRLRRLSLREGFRLFGFSDAYQIPKDLTYQQVFDLLGNSVTLNVVEMVSGRVISNLQ
jgi:DNA (cytosine-5)-methyltransferase 1